MSLSVRAYFDVQKTIAFGAISGAYAAIGTAFQHPIRCLIVNNLTAGNMQFSDDGINDKFVLASGQAMILDVASNRTSTSGELYFPKLYQLYVKQISAPTSGAIYVSAVYGKDD